MAVISNLQDFNLQSQNDFLVQQPQQKEQRDSIIKYIPLLMQEQRENFRELLGVLDLMESKGIITINRKQDEVYEIVEGKSTFKDFLIGAGIIFAIIKIGMVIAL